MKSEVRIETCRLGAHTLVACTTAAALRRRRRQESGVARTNVRRLLGPFAIVPDMYHTSEPDNFRPKNIVVTFVGRGIGSKLFCPSSIVIPEQAVYYAKYFLNIFRIFSLCMTHVFRLHCFSTLKLFKFYFPPMHNLPFSPEI